MNRILVCLFVLVFSAGLTTAQMANANPCANFPLDIAAVAQEAQTGESYCQAVLALEYMRGTSGIENQAKADELAADLIESDDPLAIYVAATLFRWGSSTEGIAKDDARSVQMYTRFVALFKESASENPHHLLALGFVRRYGRDGQDADDALGCRYIQRAAELGHPHAMYSVARCIELEHLAGTTLQDMVDWLEKAAESRHPEAAWKLAERRRDANLIDDAVQYFEAAAAFGDSDYAFRLGQLYEIGALDAADWHKARDYYQQASKAGNNRASYRLGWILLTGHRDFEKDPDSALVAFHTAQEQGNALAIKVLDILED